ncbi:MAG TPA: hypothetical protein VGC27_02475 [Rhizomicrobium sp.]
MAALFIAASVRASAYCSDTDAARAIRIVYTIGTWENLNSYVRKYRDCDDGAVAEGNSDRVADLLARRWDTIGALVELTNGDPRFERFVLYHVDSLMRPVQAQAILDNVRNHCPADAAELCRKIEKEVLASTKQ